MNGHWAGIRQWNRNTDYPLHIFGVSIRHLFNLLAGHLFVRSFVRSFNQRTISFNHFPDCPCMSAWSLLWNDVVELKPFNVSLLSWPLNNKTAIFAALIFSFDCLFRFCFVKIKIIYEKLTSITHERATT